MMQRLRKNPFFLILLPVFFVLHGFTANYDSVPAAGALLLVAEYLAISIVITGIFWIFYRDLIRAALMALVIMMFYFFFGNLQDFIKSHFPGTFILRYRFIFPFTLLFFLTFFIWLKKRKNFSLKLITYLNILFFALILIDTGWLILKIPVVAKSKKFELSEKGLTRCDSCSKPDIFLIIPDQYSGNTALKQVFHFDNSTFENELKLRGFHIAKESSSNYNLTPFSVASTLNMEYLDLKKGPQNYATVNYSYHVIRNNTVLNFLKTIGYQFYNLSIFDFDKQPAHKYKAFLPYGIKLITSQTFTSRLAEDFNFDILKGKFGRRLQNKVLYENLHFNDEIIDLTGKIAARHTGVPKFVYTHLMMPHFPYYYDKNGNPVSHAKLIGSQKANSDGYIEYLEYSNKKIIHLIDKILGRSPSPPVIILLSDHGFQERKRNYDHKYDFINLNAVFLPKKNDNLFYDSITNVNQFRVIFNTYFHQHMSFLKDSTVNVWD
jgi:hypothetical protein